MKLKVKPEGREGVWTAIPADVIKWLRGQKMPYIHNYITGGIMIGADWRKKDVIDELCKCERCAVLTGDAQRRNMRHALSVITNNALKIFDIGAITEDDLEVVTP